MPRIASPARGLVLLSATAVLLVPACTGDATPGMLPADRATTASAPATTTAADTTTAPATTNGTTRDATSGGTTVSAGQNGEGSIVIVSETLAGTAIPDVTYAVDRVEPCPEDDARPDGRELLTVRTNNAGTATATDLDPGCFSVRFDRVPASYYPLEEGPFPGIIEEDGETGLLRVQFAQGPARSGEAAVSGALRIVDSGSGEPIGGLGLILARCGSQIPLATSTAAEDGTIQLSLATTCYEVVGLPGSTAPCSVEGPIEFTPDVGRAFSVEVPIERSDDPPGTCGT
ncbi:hypothetical protein HT102_04470 [Hoyosella sp. G463]|uniref:Carboxypeptidase regulatory-like domain-containing protein n=1 Tax=Lolliginicoccus lacisalsi TaxID=2742202 RepID=A0A927JAW4_9ACTN|nr:hypothetical protein [Lolliginicoccus lacisalsi]MBD8505738.1 hypothetical protein [Lolliginicoccus lacisalsi]